LLTTTYAGIRYSQPAKRTRIAAGGKTAPNRKKAMGIPTSGRTVKSSSIFRSCPSSGGSRGGNGCCIAGASFLGRSRLVNLSREYIAGREADEHPPTPQSSDPLRLDCGVDDRIRRA
jgi:hypothetical protein